MKYFVYNYLKYFKISDTFFFLRISIYGINDRLSALPFVLNNALLNVKLGQRDAYYNCLGLKETNANIFYKRPSSIEC